MNRAAVLVVTAVLGLSAVVAAYFAAAIPSPAGKTALAINEAQPTPVVRVIAPPEPSKRAWVAPTPTGSKSAAPIAARPTTKPPVTASPTAPASSPAPAPTRPAPTAAAAEREPTGAPRTPAAASTATATAVPTNVPMPTVPTIPTAEPSQATWTLTAVGDIMLGRTVLYRINDYDDVRHPFRGTYKLLRSADLTVANLESPLSATIPPPADPHTMVFIGPARAAEGISWAGIDAVSVANNHTLTHGQQGLLQTIGAAEKHGIATFGGGSNWREAYSPTILTVKGVRVALLGFDAVYWWQWSDPGSPGIATAWDKQVRAAVSSAKRQADVVIPYFHWGAEYTATPSPEQTRLAHAAVEAGADLVLGSHPHWVQSTETYRGKLIVYSLGNFIFDQMWSQETRQGAIGHFTFRGDKLLTQRYTPVLILDYNQPVPATGSDYAAVLARLRGQP